MLVYTFKDTRTKYESLAAMSGTVNLGACRQAIPQVTMDTNSAYTVALLGSTSAAATCSKNNCAGIVGNLGVMTIDFGPGTNYLAYRVYNGATAATGGAADKMVVQLKG